MSNADFLLDIVCGDHIHQNSGHHLDGDISNNTVWQNYWRHLIVYPSQIYDAPKGKVECQFVAKVAELIESIQKRDINSERFLYFRSSPCSALTMLRDQRI
jgi:hypothetical protein